jgi:type III secretory pathway component EscT
MAWTVTGVNADLVQNQATVVFSQSGGSETLSRTINLTFQLGPINQPVGNITRQALVAQAKQILVDAGNSMAQRP